MIMNLTENTTKKLLEAFNTYAPKGYKASLLKKIGSYDVITVTDAKKGYILIVGPTFKINPIKPKLLEEEEVVQQLPSEVSFATIRTQFVPIENLEIVLTSLINEINGSSSKSILEKSKIAIGVKGQSTQVIVTKKDSGLLGENEFKLNGHIDISINKKGVILNHRIDVSNLFSLKDMMLVGGLPSPKVSAKTLLPYFKALGFKGGEKDIPMRLVKHVNTLECNALSGLSSVLYKGFNGDKLAEARIKSELGVNSSDLFQVVEHFYKGELPDGSRIETLNILEHTKDKNTILKWMARGTKQGEVIKSITETCEVGTGLVFTIKATNELSKRLNLSGNGEEFFNWVSFEDDSGFGGGFGFGF